MRRRTQQKVNAAIEPDEEAEHLLPKFVMSLDIGTTNIRCFIYDQTCKIIGKSQEKVDKEFPEESAVEMDPEKLWDKIKNAIKNSIEDSKLTPHEITCMGISLQRGTFLLWDKKTGKPISNFIVWQDTRATKLAEESNNGLWFQFLQKASRCLHFISRRKKFLAAAVLKFSAQQVSMRLAWFLQKHPEVKQQAIKGEVCFATLDTWVMWKLTGGETYATEYSNASSTALYDPFVLSWSSFVCGLLDIPMKIFPPVLDTNADFGSCVKELFGAEIPIRCAAGDQQAAMFGQCCFDEGDVKLTMGTGAFLDMNVGSKAHASVNGFYPVIGWKIGDEVVQLAEGCSNTCGDAIQWIQKIHLISKPSECDEIARNTDNDHGIYFVPGFNGLQSPKMNYSACGALLGLTLNTEPDYITKAVLESLAFRNYELYDTLVKETNKKVCTFVCDGGVSECDFILQMSSNLIGRNIDRRSHKEMSALGVAFFAGLACRVWKDKKELRQIVETRESFTPNKKLGEAQLFKYTKWEKATIRAMNWYE